MKQELQEKLSLFISNIQLMKDGFKWRNSMISHLASFLYTLENKTLDCSAIRESNTIIKRNTSILSTFRGDMSLCLAAMLSLKDNREKLFADIKAAHKMMKSVGFFATENLIVSAYEIATKAPAEYYKQIIFRSIAFYDCMKATGFFRTGADSYIFAAILGLSDIDVKTGTQRITQLYTRLKPDFSPGNSVQILAEILVLGGESDSVIERLYTLNNELKNKNLRLDKQYTMSFLGVLALLSVDINTIVQDIEDAVAFLKMEKEFSSFFMTKQDLLLMASPIVASVYAEDVKKDILSASISTSIIGIIIAAQQASVIASIAASNAASSS